MRDGTWGRLKACAEDGCRWAFYDASRNQSGRWCSMAVCGNRPRAAGPTAAASPTRRSETPGTRRGPPRAGVPVSCPGTHGRHRSSPARRRAAVRAPAARRRRGPDAGATRARAGRRGRRRGRGRRSSAASSAVGWSRASGRCSAPSRRSRRATASWPPSTARRCRARRQPAADRTAREAIGSVSRRRPCAGPADARDRHRRPRRAGRRPRRRREPRARSRRAGMPGACTERALRGAADRAGRRGARARRPLPVVVVGHRHAHRPGAVRRRVHARPATGGGAAGVPARAGDLDGLDALPALRSQFRTYGWIAPIEPGAIHSWDIEDLLATEAEAKTSLQRADAAFTLEAPDAALRDVRRTRASRSGASSSSAASARRCCSASRCWRRAPCGATCTPSGGGSTCAVRGAGTCGCSRPPSSAGSRWRAWSSGRGRCRRRRRRRGRPGGPRRVGDRRRARCSRRDGLLALALALGRRDRRARGRAAPVAAARAGASATLDVVAVAAARGAGARRPARHGGRRRPRRGHRSAAAAGARARLARGRHRSPTASSGRWPGSASAPPAAPRRPGWRSWPSPAGPEAAAATVAFLAVSIGLAVFAGVLPRDARARPARPGGVRRAARRHRDRRPRARARRSTPRRIDQLRRDRSRAPSRCPCCAATPPCRASGRLAAARRGARGAGRGAADAALALRLRRPLAVRSSPRRWRRATSRACRTTPVPEGATRLRLPVTLDGVSVVLLLYGQAAVGPARARRPRLVQDRASRPSRPTRRRSLAGGSHRRARRRADGRGQRHRGAPGRRGRHGRRLGRRARIMLGPLQAAPAATALGAVTDWNGFTGIDGLRPGGEAGAAGVPFSYILSSGGHGVVRLPQPTDDEPRSRSPSGPGVAAAAGPGPHDRAAVRRLPRQRA